MCSSDLLEQRAVEHIHLFLVVAVVRVLQLAANHHRLTLHIARALQIQRDIGKRRLKTNARRHIYIKHKFLQRLFDLFVSQVVVLDKRREQRIEIAKSLRASRLALQRIKEIHHLPENRPEMFSRFARNLILHPGEAAAQQILQIPADTVHAHQIQVMDMNITRTVQPPNFRRINLV